MPPGDVLAGLLKSILTVRGVRDAAYDPGTNILKVEYHSDSTVPADIGKIIRTNGVHIIEKPVKFSSPEEETLSHLPWMIRLTAICFLTMVSAYVAEKISGIPVWIHAVLYMAAYISGGYYSLRAALDSLRARKFDVNFLMIIAALGAAIVGQPFEGAILMFLFSLSNTLETYAMGRTYTSVRALLDMTPKTARVSRPVNGEQKIVEVPVEDLRAGEVVLVRPGEQIPADGLVIRGESAVTEASITGESIPSEKQPGSKVFAGTLNGNGALDVKVTVEVENSILNRIVKTVEEAREKKARSQDFTDRIIGQYYAMAVIGIAALAFIVPVLFLGWNFSDSIYRAITLMVVASPCALVISIPAAILSALASSARQGVLFKGGSFIEKAAEVNVVAFDKTGTLTTGRPGVIAIVPFDDGKHIPQELFVSRVGVWYPADDQIGSLSEAQLAIFSAAASVEHLSEHPLAKAIVRGAEERGIPLLQAGSFEAFTGMGAQARVSDIPVRIGRKNMFGQLDGRHLEYIDAFEKEGRTVVVIGDETPWGILVISDTIRPESAEAVARLKNQGIGRVVLITGDNRQVAEKLGNELGVDEIYAELFPDEKVRTLEKLRREYGAVAMVGDGINDAPALATADVGIAMGAAGTDVALESADVLLMSDDLSRLPGVLREARRTRRVVRQNLTFAFIVMVTLMILAMIGEISLPIGVIGHEGSTLVVVANGLRLLWRRT